MIANKLINKVLSIFLLYGFLLLLCSINSFSQFGKHEIYLNKVITNKIKSGHDYQFVNQNDTTFITIKYNGDFGLVDSSYLVVNDNLPDGEYKIFVDNILVKEFYFKNGLKENLWVEYRDNGEKQTVQFFKGKIKGNVFEYFSNGNLKSKSYFSSKGIKKRISYYNSGGIKLKEYFRKNKQNKIKTFDTKGKLIETKVITN